MGLGMTTWQYLTCNTLGHLLITAILATLCVRLVDCHTLVLTLVDRYWQRSLPKGANDSTPIYHNRQIIRFSLAQTNQSSWPWTNIKADEYEFYNSITCIIYYMYCTYWHGDFHRKHLHSEKETRMKEDCHCI